MNMSPKIIFIVPYRDRLEHKLWFSNHMEKILQDAPDYEIYYIHQCDTRSFNRGAMKNIGFLAMKAKYPDYKNITFVFNDVDTAPAIKLNYLTVPGVIKHFYGFTFALGGVVSVIGSDFEKMNGFPNFWGWGYEDNLLQLRAKIENIRIDRSQFYPIRDPRFLVYNHGIYRTVNKIDFQHYNHHNPEGCREIVNLKYSLDDEFVNVSFFQTGREEDTRFTTLFDLTTQNSPFSNRRMPMLVNTTPLPKNIPTPTQRFALKRMIF